MKREESDITITDQFCGCGGSSDGAQQADPDIRISLALNHWKLAIDTHSHNFKNTIHDCADISATDPRRYPSTTILITSPECTNHSLAKGKKWCNLTQEELFYAYNKGKLDPSAERSRATMWDVPRFAEFHKYEIVIVENVVDVRKWVMWEAWIKAMHLLGYKHRCVYLNSMHCHPTPQSRDRIYIIFWKKGNREPDLDIRPKAWCPKCDRDINAWQSWKPDRRYGKYRQQYVYACPDCATVVEPYYYAAFNAIDWSIPGERIGDRKRPLAEKTLARIRYGLDKYGKQPFLVTNKGQSKAHPIQDYARTITGIPHIGLASPFIINLSHTHSGEKRSASLSGPLSTQTTKPLHGMCTPPFIVELRGTGKARPIDRELSTVTAGGNNHGIVADAAMNSFMSYYYGNIQASHITDPVGTISTRDRAFKVNYDPETLRVDDCYYRIIKPHEVGRAMAFRDDYVVLGNGGEKVRQYGNAVTPPVMKELVSRCIKSLETREN